jgi:hypothetical protein
MLRNQMWATLIKLQYLSWILKKGNKDFFLNMEFAVWNSYCSVLPDIISDTELTSEAQTDLVPTQEKIESKNSHSENRSATKINVNTVSCIWMHITNKDKREIMCEL